jgi:hypothetical protein
MAKFDPYLHERSYKRWHAKGMPFPGLSDALACVIRDFLQDMEVGANVNPNGKKGPRSYCRLNNLRSRMQAWGYYLQKELRITSWQDMESKERELLVLVKRMRDGDVKSRGPNCSPLTSVGTYVKILKSFWRWYRCMERRKGRTVDDITSGIDGKDLKPKFNYLTIEDVKNMCAVAKQEYRILMMFLFDSGIRAPTELMNVRISDLEWDSKSGICTLSIRDEAAKTFGRKIKLMLCSEILREHLQMINPAKDDYLFTKVPMRVNFYLKRLGLRIKGIGTKVHDGPYGIKGGLTMYDFRHASACFWLSRYKSESALKYRFGWKKSDMIHYYTELLGMKDTIQEDDLYVDVTKTDLERQMADKTREIELLQEQLTNQDRKMEEIMKVLRALQVEKLVKEQVQT